MHIWPRDKIFQQKRSFRNNFKSSQQQTLQIDEFKMFKVINKEFILEFLFLTL